MNAMRFNVSLTLLLWLVPSAPARVVDCAGAACPAVVITGTQPAVLPDGTPSPFRGFADASIRQDPDTDRLWMAYSWPSIGSGQPARRRLFKRPIANTPQVQIHLASSDDGGETWRFEHPLWAAEAQRSPSGQPGHMSQEVANLLPVQTPQGTVWYGARLEYFIPKRSGYRGRPPSSFRILLARAPCPADLARAPAARLGSMATDPAWGLDVNLAALSPETRHCQLWNEPALYHDGNELFLVLSGMAFRGSKPDLAKSDLFVFATRATGDPAGWQWRYAGRFSGAAEARELGGERLTQIELASGRDGTLLALVTPDTWDDAAQDFVHHGCRILEVDTRGRSLRLARTAEGKLKLRATIVASDAGRAGTAAATYDPASATGVVFGKRSKTGAGAAASNRQGRDVEFSSSLHRTHLHP